MLYGRSSITMPYHKKVNAVAVVTDNRNVDFRSKLRYNNIILTFGDDHMAKLSITTDQGRTAVKCRLSRDETVIGKELDFIASCPTQFFMRPRMAGNKTIIFTGADGIPMSSVLKIKMNKDRYFLIVAQLVEMLRSAQQYGFDLNRLVLDPKFMLMNKQSGQIFIPYMTVSKCETPNGGIVRCLREVSTLARFTTDYDFSFADNFMYFVMSMGRFSLADAEDYIRVNSPRTYNDMVRLPSIQSLQTIQHRSKSSPTEGNSGFSLFRFIYGRAAYAVEETEEEAITAPPPQYAPRQEAAPNPFAPPANTAPEPVSHAEENADKQEDIHNIPEEPPVQDIPSEPPTNIHEAEEHEPSDSTMELDAALILRPAKLTRRSTEMVYSVNKPVFIIGKESIKVDLCIPDNRAISRVHASIVCKNSIFYIIDQNSTNRTYVNGVNVPPHVEYRLKDGDEIKLANEFFDFKVN